MKQIKNATLAILGGLVILAVATVSCSHKSGGGTTATPTISGIAPSASDTIGQVITITGTNFTSSSTVTVGGIAATPVTFTSSTSISVTIPAGVASATVVPVIVTTGSSASTASNITVVPGASAFTIDGKNSSNQVETSSIIAHWTFDGSTNESTTGNPPQLTGGTTTFVTGKIGQAVHFANAWLTYPVAATAASNDNTALGSNDTLQNGYTISMWIQVPDTSLLTDAFALYSPNIPNYPLTGIWYRRHTGNIFDFDGGMGTVDGGGSTVDYHDFQAGGTFSFDDSLTWAFIAMVYDTTGGHKLVYYANNVKIATISLASSLGIADEPMLMIAPNYATFGTAEAYQRTPGDVTTSNTVPSYMSDGLTGNIDDVRLYSKTLSATDINDLYQLGNHGQ